MKRVLLSLALIQAVALFGQEAAKPDTKQEAKPETKQEETPKAPAKKLPPRRGVGTYVVFQTSMGRITCRLYEKETPKTVANFIGLAEGTKEWTHPGTKAKMVKTPLYNGTVIHKKRPNFIIQGGDPLGNGKGNPGFRTEDEFVPGFNFNVAGRLAMANAGRPDTNGSQFFITEVPLPSLDGKYTIFGQVIEGLELVGKIARNPNKVTLDKVIIQRIK